MPSDGISFEVKGLYVLLSDIGAEVQFHWGLYLAKTDEEGQIFHLIRGPHTDGGWQYQTKFVRSDGVSKSVTLLVGMKIGTIDTILQERLAARLAELPISRYPNSPNPDHDISCRLWIREALHMLNEEGFLNIIGSYDEIEMEVLLTAADNKARKKKSVFQSLNSKD